MNQKVVTFGEIMLRLKSPGYERFFQSPALEATFGGSEANVAVSLANYGVDAAYVTKLPTHAIGQAAVNSHACASCGASGWTLPRSSAGRAGWAFTIWRPARCSAPAR